jgi:predicted DNA-binding transcriptional regulator AlpA
MNQSQKQPVERLTYRLSELASAFGVSRRTIERERSAGRFPQPDLHIGRAPLWTKKAVNNWIEQGGGRHSKKHAERC